jgi:N-acetylmuramoyl-L-alanine amidase
VIGLALFLQVALAQPPEALTVVGGVHRASIPLVDAALAPSLAAELLATVLPTELERQPSGRYLLRIGGVPFELADQMPFTRVGDEIVPLVSAPHVRDGKLHVPLQIVAELYPRHAPGASFDPDRMELRLAPAPRIAEREESAVGVGGESPRAGAARSVDAGAATNVPVVPATKPDSARAGTSPASIPPRRRVVVDAGHGGRDAGTSGRTRSGRRLIEKDVALAVAHLVAKELRARDIEVVMTRSTDVFVELPERGRIANAERGDIFISIHVNAAAPRARNGSAARGVETYFLAVAKTEDAQRVADMENASVRFETAAEVARDDPLAFIINDMAENEHLRESSDLAAVIQRRLSARHPAQVGDRGVKQGPFRVLVTSYMPAVLVELGFATNSDDAAYLLDSANQKQMAEAIAAAAVDYFQDYERRVGSGSTHR